MRLSTFAGALCLIAMLLLASPGVRVERAQPVSAPPAAAAPLATR
jgi:hypothetical protein